MAIIVWRIMEERGISQRQLAAKLGMSSHSRLSDRLNGKTKWEMEDVFALAKVLGVQPSWLVAQVEQLDSAQVD